VCACVSLTDRGFGEERGNENCGVVERHKIINIRSVCLLFSLAQWASLGVAGPILWLWAMGCTFALLIFVLSRKFHGLPDQMCRLLTWFHLTSNLSTSQILSNILLISPSQWIQLINSFIFIYTSFKIHFRNLSFLTVEHNSQDFISYNIIYPDRLEMIRIFHCI